MTSSFSSKRLVLIVLFCFVVNIFAVKSKATGKSSETPVGLSDSTSTSSAEFTIPPGSMLETILSFAGPILFICLQVSSALTAYEIDQKKSVGKLSPIPFGSLWTNCFIWSTYGFLKKDMTVFLPNMSGLYVAAFCIMSYQRHATAQPMLMYKVMVGLSTLCQILALMEEVQWIGLMGCILSIVLSGAPLAVIRTVITEQSTAALPFNTSLITWLNNFSWILYGYLIANDPLIYYPNILGFILSSLQMLLFVRYGFPKKREEVDNSSDTMLQRL